MQYRSRTGSNERYQCEFCGSTKWCSSKDCHRERLLRSKDSWGRDKFWLTFGKQIYFIGTTDMPGSVQFVKIGASIDPEKRLYNLQGSCPLNLELLKVIKLDPYKDVPSQEELKIKQQFEHLNVRGEWFRGEQELLEYIDNI